MLILNPQWRQAAGISAPPWRLNLVPLLLGWALGRFPAPRNLLKKAALRNGVVRRFVY